ncbi:pilus assembly protein PilM [Candidatus Nomurabacteria bacterium]|nr:pilus assembly protein PilM [Candidatus Nomurabacteria bacterium]
MSVLDAVSYVLPTPNYLRIPSAGVDVSDTSLKYILFEPDSYSGNKLQLKYWGDIDIADGALSRGEVADVDELSRVLKEVKSRTGVQHVRVSLPEERAYLFETAIKRDTPYKEVRGLLEFKLEENVPLSPRDAYFDYHIFDEPSDSSQLMVGVTVYARETVNSYYEACRKAGVIPLSFEVEAQAIARASIARGEQGTHMIVDFGKTRTGIGIVHRGELMYTSTIDIGGKELSNALRRQLGELPEHELTDIKNTQGLVRGSKDSRVYEAIVSTMSAIKDEITLRLQYWDSRATHTEDKYVDSVILCGGSCNLKGLPDYFTETLKIDTVRADVWQNALDIEEDVPPIGRRYSYGYATAIGLALTSFMQNL